MHVQNLELFQNPAILLLTLPIRDPPGRGGHGNQLMYGRPGPGGPL